MLILKPEEAKSLEEGAPEELQVSSEPSEADGNEKGYNGVPEISQDLGDVLVQDFVAAWLSEWIYFADPLKPVAVPTMKSHGWKRSFCHMAAKGQRCASEVPGAF